MSEATTIIDLYDVIKLNLPELPFKNVYFNTMQEDLEGDVGIYLYESSNDLEDMSGDVYMRNIKVQVQVNSFKSFEGLKQAIEYLTLFVNKIEYNAETTDKISLMGCKHIGPVAIPIGRNKFGILVCRSTIDLKYNFN